MNVSPFDIPSPCPLAVLGLKEGVITASLYKRELQNSMLKSKEKEGTKRNPKERNVHPKKTQKTHYVARFYFLQKLKNKHLNQRLHLSLKVHLLIIIIERGYTWEQ